MVKYITTAFLLAFAACVPMTARATSTPANSLVYFWQKGCAACADWDTHVGRLYAKTDEAKRLPLRQVDIDHRPPDLTHVEGVHYTPTFLVLHCGHEVARIIGYNSDFQFWGLLDQAMRKLPKSNRCK